MRKKINVSDLKTGMFVDEFCGSWMDHPFWKSSFKLSQQKDLVTIQKSGVREVWIDTAKGLDVASQINMESTEEVNKKSDEILQQAAVQHTQAEARVSLDQEMDRAKKIQSKAKQAVMSMFQEARMGNALQLGEATSLVDEINQSVSRNPGALLSLARLKTKDDYTYLHSVAVCALMIALGKHMGIEGDTLKSLGMAGLLHDVGKMAIPDDVLNKPGRLTDQEFDVVKTHPCCGLIYTDTSIGAIFT